MEIAVKEFTFLGDRLTSHGVVPDDRKVSAMKNMKVPEDSKDLQRFGGMVTYLAKWIPNLSEKTALLRQLRCSIQSFERATDECTST